MLQLFNQEKIRIKINKKVPRRKTNTAGNDSRNKEIQ